jgi:hypothetical protein
MSAATFSGAVSQADADLRARGCCTLALAAVDDVGDDPISASLPTSIGWK